MNVEILEDGMERSMKQGLKSLQKMRNILEVSRFNRENGVNGLNLKTRVRRMVE